MEDHRQTVPGACLLAGQASQLVAFLLEAGHVGACPSAAEHHSSFPACLPTSLPTYLPTYFVPTNATLTPASKRGLSVGTSLAARGRKGEERREELMRWLQTTFHSTEFAGGTKVNHLLLNTHDDVCLRACVRVCVHRRTHETSTIGLVSLPIPVHSYQDHARKDNDDNNKGDTNNNEIDVAANNQQLSLIHI